MSGNASFSLRIFVVDGDPDGLRVIDRTNWNGKALVFPRTLLPKIKQRAEFGHARCSSSPVEVNSTKRTCNILKPN